MFALWGKYLGDQWSIGDWDGMLAAAPNELPAWLASLVGLLSGPEPPQNLKEYDPEWGRAFWTGTVGASCRHDRMLSSVKVPVLLTHHFWTIDESTGSLVGALSGEQAMRARQLIEATRPEGGVSIVPENGPFDARPRSRALLDDAHRVGVGASRPSAVRLITPRGRGRRPARAARRTRW